MFTLRRPSDLDLTAFRLRQGRLGYSYPHVGCTRTESRPPGYDADYHGIRLGDGPDVFAAARDALRRWEQFPRPWVSIAPPLPPAREGAVVVVLARVFGAWVRNACRVVDVTDEPGRFAVTYGTLPGHVEEGEERFGVELRADGSVWYDVLAYSRPQHPLARLAYPVVRHLQRRFARDSLAAMTRAAGARTDATGPEVGPVAAGLGPEVT